MIPSYYLSSSSALACSFSYMSLAFVFLLNFVSSFLNLPGMHVLVFRPHGGSTVYILSKGGITICTLVYSFNLPFF